jgi:hypothetical protein
MQETKTVVVAYGLLRSIEDAQGYGQVNNRHCSKDCRESTIMRQSLCWLKRFLDFINHGVTFYIRRYYGNSHSADKK